MLLRSSFAVLATTALLLTAPMAAASSLDAVKAKYIETWSSVNSFKCDIHIETSQVDEEAGAEMDMNSTGNMQALRQSDGSFFWRMDLEMAINMPAAGMEIEAKVTTVYDGEFVHTVMEFMGQKQVSRTRDHEKSTVPIGESMWEGLEEDTTLTYIGEGEVNGIPVYLVRAEWEEEDEDAPAGGAVYSFRQDNALVLRAEIEVGDEPGTIIMTASNYDLAADVDESAFQVEIPVGANILDLE